MCQRHGSVVVQSQLPPTFSSLFRLFLRATSASVLHNSRSTRNLRRVWRPTFNAAAKVVHRLQSVQLESGERERLQDWLKVWDTRLDNTLTLLYSSSQSRGLPHELTQNLSFLLGHHLKWTQKHYYTSSGTWRPQLDPSSPEYLPWPMALPTQKMRDKAEKMKKHKRFDRSAWGALGEVVRMAEGRHGISLGRATFNERKAVDQPR